LAFVFALLCAVIGSYAFFINHATYHNVFSSFVRATSVHEVHAMLSSESNGADPLPADLAKIKISMNSAKGEPGLTVYKRATVPTQQSVYAVWNGA
jgi:hypothetical protein